MLWVGLGVLGGALFMVSAAALLRRPAPRAGGPAKASPDTVDPFELTRRPDLAALAHRAEPRPVDQLVPPRWLRRDGAPGPTEEGPPDGVEVTGRRRRPVRVVQLRELEQLSAPAPVERRLRERRGHRREGLSL